MAVSTNIPPNARPDRDHVIEQLNYGTDSVRRLWDYAHDNDFWQTRAIPLPDHYPECQETSIFGEGTCLDGRIWVHAETDVGKDTANQFAGTVFVGHHGSDLANHYVDSRPDEATRAFTRPIPNPHVIFLWQTLPDPGPDVDPSLLTLGKQHESLVLLSSEARSGDSVTRVTVGVTPLRTITTDTFLSQGTMDAMNADAARFVSGADPGRALNKTGPVAVLVSHDGTAIVDTVNTAGHGLLLASEWRQLSGPFTSGVLAAEAGATSASAVHSGLAPAARVDYQASYSALAEQVFVLGGEDAATGVPLSDAWAFDLSVSSGWRPIPIAAGTLHHVLAASYVFFDRSLWVLDEVGRGSRHASLRLLRIDPDTGSVTTLGTFPRSRAYTRYYMAATGDDHVALTAAPPTGKRGFVTTRLGRTVRGMRAGQVTRFEDELVSAPFVDEHGTHAFVNAPSGDGVVRDLISPKRSHDRGEEDDDDLERRCVDLF